MNIVIINHTINTDNIEINKFSTKINRGDNKNLLYTLPYKALKDNNWFIIYFEDLLKISGSINDKIKIYLNKNDDIKIILFFRANTFITKYWEEIKQLSIYKMIYIDDLHNSKEIQELKILDKYFFNFFDMILSTYAYCFNKFFKYVNKEKIYWFPHSFNESFTIKYNNNPKDYIFLSGCICDVYPYRQKLFNLKDKYPIDILEHPKYCKNKLHNIIGRKFIEKINEYRYSFTCCSNQSTPYIIQKFFEIPAAGSLLIAFDKYVINELNELGFKDMYNYISVDENNFEDKIEWILNENNRDIIEEIRFNGYNFINNNHTHSIRFNKMLNDIFHKS